MDRREFLAQTMGATILAALPADSIAASATQVADASWDRGQLRHLLPTVNESRMLIKASFVRPLTAPPRLRVGTATAAARMTDTRGEYWQSQVAGLSPGRRYPLSLTAAGGTALCQPWELSTFPAPGTPRDRFRVLFFTCAGGPESDNLTTGYLPTAVRNRLLRRALSFAPDAAVANGDHIYWDLHARGGGPVAAGRLASFPRSALVFGDTNETVLKLAAGPQIVPVYGTDFRSTPVFFLQDDHQADRATRLRDCRLHARPNRLALLQVGCEDRATRGNRPPRAVSRDRTGKTIACEEILVRGRWPITSPALS